MRTLLAALSAALVMTLSPLALPASYAGEYPTSPDGDPPGANDWSCQPTAARPTPVILVHGTFGDRKHLLERLSQAIKDEGFCVFSLDYGNRGTGDIADSARELKRYTQRVLEATGAERVSMVGHSQGGMMPRYYVKFLGGTAVVDDLVGMAPSNHGTTISQGDNAGCRACEQQAAGSRFLQRLNAGDETPGGVSYTQITTRYDEVVAPHTSGYLAAGPRTTNLTIQDVCPLDVSEHLLIPTSTTTIAIALNALTRSGPARPDVEVACL
ncbi:MAG: alpha/beta fold hydrolase [Nocardioides sp.]